jgi:hypothetical protein
MFWYPATRDPSLNNKSGIMWVPWLKLMSPDNYPRENTKSIHMKYKLITEMKDFKVLETEGCSKINNTNVKPGYRNVW